MILWIRAHEIPFLSQANLMLPYVKCEIDMLLHAYLQDCLNQWNWKFKLLDVDFAVIFSLCAWLRPRMWSERIFFRHLFIFYFVFWFQAERFLSGDKRIPVRLSDYCQQSRERATNAGLPGIYKYEIIP